MQNIGAGIVPFDSALAKDLAETIHKFGVFRIEIDSEIAKPVSGADKKPGRCSFRLFKRRRGIHRPDPGRKLHIPPSRGIHRGLERCEGLLFVHEARLRGFVHRAIAGNGFLIQFVCLHFSVPLIVKRYYKTLFFQLVNDSLSVFGRLRIGNSLKCESQRRGNAFYGCRLQTTVADDLSRQNRLVATWSRTVSPDICSSSIPVACWCFLPLTTRLFRSLSFMLRRRGRDALLYFVNYASQ